MKSAQLMLASERGQINPTRSLSQRVESVFQKCQELRFTPRSKPVTPHGRRGALVADGGGNAERAVRVSARPARRHGHDRDHQGHTRHRGHDHEHRGHAH